jgi:hypothetical protein
MEKEKQNENVILGFPFYFLISLKKGNQSNMGVARVGKQDDDDEPASLSVDYRLKLLQQAS